MDIAKCVMCNIGGWDEYPFHQEFDKMYLAEEGNSYYRKKRKKLLQMVAEEKANADQHIQGYYDNLMKVFPCVIAELILVYLKYIAPHRILLLFPLREHLHFQTITGNWVQSVIQVIGKLKKPFFTIQDIEKEFPNFSRYLHLYPRSFTVTRELHLGFAWGYRHRNWEITRSKRGVHARRSIFICGSCLEANLCKFRVFDLDALKLITSHYDTMSLTYSTTEWQPQQ